MYHLLHLMHVLFCLINLKINFNFTSTNANAVIISYINKLSYSFIYFSAV